MKIALVCNKSEESARCDQLVGYNQVYAWHLRDALRRAGTEAVLSKDRDLPNLEESTAAIAISAMAHHWFKANAEDMDPGSRYLVTDGPTRGLATLDGHKIPGAYIGMGADPAVCYPEQDPGKPVVLFNAYNRDMDQGETDNPRHQACVLALESLAASGEAEVWTLNCPLPFADRVIGKPKEEKAGYVPWVEYMEAVRKAWIFLDATPKVIELGRVEAAACGSVLVDPVHPADSMEGLGYMDRHDLPLYGDDLELLLTAIIGGFSRDMAKQRQSMIQDYFSWDLCASRLLKALS